MPSAQKKHSFDKSFAHLDGHIQQGRIHEARQELQELTKGKVPREVLCEVTRLARRVGLNALALKLLNPIVRSKSRKLFIATDEEKIEYSAALIWAGAVTEAKWLLKEVDFQKTPEAWLTHAYAYLFEWDYFSAIEPLKKYISHTEGYKNLVGKINLAASFVAVRNTGEAAPLLEELRESTIKRYPRLYANALELSAQSSVFAEDYTSASKYLSEASKSFKDSFVLDSLYIEKWQLVSELNQQSERGKFKARLLDLKGKAIQMSHWETVRECDKYLAIDGDDLSLLHRVYFGTPFPAYRSFMLKDFAKKISLPRTYLWTGDQKADNTNQTLSLYDGMLDGKTCGIKPGLVLHRLLHLLCSDFYKPFSVASVFGALFPGEYFHPEVGPARVYQAIRLLKGWIDKKKLPLKILSLEGTYQLQNQGSLGILISSQEARKHPQLRVLFSEFQENKFTAVQASQALKLPLRSLQRFLSLMVDEKLIQMTRSRNSVLYSIIRKR